MINAFTHAAQKLGSLQRIEIERFADAVGYSSIVLYEQPSKSLAFSCDVCLKNISLKKISLTFVGGLSDILASFYLHRNGLDQL